MFDMIVLKSKSLRNTRGSTRAACSLHSNLFFAFIRYIDKEE